VSRVIVKATVEATVGRFLRSSKRHRTEQQNTSAKCQVILSFCLKCLSLPTNRAVVVRQELVPYRFQSPVVEVDNLFPRLLVGLLTLARIEIRHIARDDAVDGPPPNCSAARNRDVSSRCRSEHYRREKAKSGRHRAMRWRLRCVGRTCA
jgi:hypothetical protein